MSFDLSKFDTATLANNGAPVPLVSPLGDVIIGTDEKPVTFYIYGQDSKKFRDAINEIRRRNVGKKAKVKTPDEEDAEAIERLADLTAGWSNNFDLDGHAFKYSRENAIKLYSDSRFQWLYEQINRAVMNRANFLAE